MGGGGVLVASAERGALISCLIQGNSNATWGWVIVWHDRHSRERERPPAADLTVTLDLYNTGDIKEIIITLTCKATP